jgi:2-keto-4-pentenoate hydratase/2-oxohepta-3-ene-1,7-dioic acid hydratase in catechol pathway
MRLCRFVPKSDPSRAPRWAEFEGTGADGRLMEIDGDPMSGTAEGTREIYLATSVKLCAPVAPTKIIGVGLNYRRHAEEMKKPLPDEPLLFLKPPSALLDPDADIVRPSEWSRTDYEGEVALVIRRRARRVSVETALDYVFGVTALNDVTVRDLQKKDIQYTRAKGFDTFAPVGPCVTTLDQLKAEGHDLGALRIRTTLNGELRQDSTTADLIFDLPTLVSFISHVMTLEPGDVITTGTPSGVGPMQPGDVVAITIDGVGTLENPVVGEPV